MKAKQTQVAQATSEVVATPNSLKDAGYKLALAGESTRAVAQYVMEQCPAIVKDLNVLAHKELRADLAEGYKLRAHELWGINYYTVSKDTGAWLLIGNSIKTPGIQAKLDEMTKDKREIKQVNVHFAKSFSTSEYGQMRHKDPEQRKAIDSMWIDFNKYENDRNDALIKAIKSIMAGNDNKTRVRKDVLFIDAVIKAFDALDKSSKVKQDRGDKTADQLRFRMAKDAFLKAYNTK